mmetsp:Transcript_33040/g.83923  ORF Transcript_33040/g.83923 Transcript_33040/m.83923 type:complete len:253 (-) Transcript_33040:116-874(-)
MHALTALVESACIKRAASTRRGEGHDEPVLVCERLLGVQDLFHTIEEIVQELPVAARRGTLERLELLPVALAQRHGLRVEAGGAQVDGVHRLRQHVQAHGLPILLQALRDFRLVQGSRGQGEVQQLGLHMVQDLLVLPRLVPLSNRRGTPEEVLQRLLADCALNLQHAVQVLLQGFLPREDEHRVLIAEETLARDRGQHVSEAHAQLLVQLTDLAIALVDVPGVAVGVGHLDGIRGVPFRGGVPDELDSEAT